MKKLIFLSFVIQCTFVMGMDISDLDKVKLVKALYNRAQVQGMGIYHQRPGSLSDSQATNALRQGYIDYLNGRVMKVDLSGDSLDTYLYNRDNGPQAAEKVIQQLRSLN